MFDIKQYIAKSGLTQREFGERLGYTESYISRITNGQVPMNDKFIQKCKAIFGEMSINEIKSIAEIDQSQFTLVPFLPIAAQAGYLDSLETHLEYLNLEPMLIPTQLETGNYLVIEISGDSMNDNTTRSIVSGDKLLCKELQRDHWRNKLHFNQYLFVIMSRDGIVCKQITGHDLTRGVVTCHSWNELWRDYEVHLDDVYKLFYVKKIVERKINF